MMDVRDNQTTQTNKQIKSSYQLWHKERMAFKNCGHKLLHLTHDSNNNRRDEERKKERWQM
jgi:hypothetical protein